MINVSKIKLDINKNTTYYNDGDYTRSVIVTASYDDVKVQAKGHITEVESTTLLAIERLEKKVRLLTIYNEIPKDNIIERDRFR